MGQLGWFYPPTIPGVNHQVEDLRGEKGELAMKAYFEAGLKIPEEDIELKQE